MTDDRTVTTSGEVEQGLAESLGAFGPILMTSAAPITRRLRELVTG